MASRSPYNGQRRKLVLAFDVGTTYSGISYSVLDPGRVPEIKGVTRFPAHEHVSGSSKIPTIIYYDRSGNVKAVGAETVTEEICAQAEDEQWVKAEWFKLHLRSKGGPKLAKEITKNIPPLPLNKTVVEVFADFLFYLFKCASNYIQDAHPNGVDLWASVKGEIYFVLSHPNGWGGAQQADMRRAAVTAGLIPNTTAGHARLSFVTEGEASLHFAVQNGLATSGMKNGEGVVIVDAGGGTIDISSYSAKKSASMQTFDEVAIPQCHFHGSVFVSLYAHRFLSSYLSDSSYIADIDNIIERFDKTTKLRFRNADTPQYIKFGSTRDNDAGHNIRFGQLKILGTDIAQFFKPSIDCIIEAVKTQRLIGHRVIRERLEPTSDVRKHVVLVGGFAASEYLLARVLAALKPYGLKIYRPENHVNKAVADGAVSFYLDRYVRSRISKLTYGVRSSVPYNPMDWEHRKRDADTFRRMWNGWKYVGGVFDTILPKYDLQDTLISELKTFRRAYWQEATSLREFKSSSFDIFCYHGHDTNPKWIDMDTKNYSRLCTIYADLSHLPLAASKNLIGPGKCYKLDFDIVLTLGLTELKAQVAWMERGIEKRSEAKIVYDPDTRE
ncbi:hypothetical protein BDN70DRAFT_931447 [Pholiota conissans]|uniref:Heat shock 70 kDa protein 12A n=1 Tax=Pholiota conissans TaxID=109636 RepID=A0A9P5Z4X3_9AGAR|nr:hypothetical protein BDN70DRAFT_931447 [Pholiota conissans]